MAKTFVKKNSKKNHSSETASKKKIFLTLIIVLLLVLLIAGIFAILKTYVPDIFGGSSLAGKLAAKVNSKEITLAELDEGYSKLPMQYRIFMSKEDYLEQLIDQELLKQEAVKTGILITDLEADQNIREFISKNNITDEELREILKNQSMDYDSLIAVSKEQLAVQKLLERDVSSQIEITTAEAESYFNQNKESFANPSMLTVRHILVGTTSRNRTQQQSEVLANQILAKILPDKSNFCKLVNESSEDIRSLATCGEYQFTKGQLPEEFENWSVSSDADSIGIVSTEYGVHVMWLINKTTEETMSFDEVREQIITSLKQQEERKVYEQYLTGLRNKSTIKNYLAKTESKQEVIEETNPVIEQETNPDLNQEITVQETSVDNEVKEPETQIETPSAPVKPAEAQQETVQPTTTVSIQSDSVFLKCLSEKETTLYGASWNKDTTRQKNLLGSNFDSIKYVECAVPGDYKSQAAECKTAKIDAYPTWTIAGTQYMGVYSLVQLADLAGCR